MNRAASMLGQFAIGALALGLLGSWLWLHLGVQGQRLVQRESVAVSALTDSAAHATADASAHYIQTNLQRSRIVQAHAHYLNLCLLIMAVAILLAASGLDAVKQQRLAGSLIFGVLVYPIGLVADGVGYSALGHGMALIGSLAIVGVVLFVVVVRFRTPVAPAR